MKHIEFWKNGNIVITIRNIVLDFHYAGLFENYHGNFLRNHNILVKILCGIAVLAEENSI